MKKAKTENGFDYISKLPDPALRLILSRLDSTEEVIRTSVLSRRWEYLWTSVPSLHIDAYRDPTETFDGEVFKHFMYWVIVSRSQDLDTFTLHCSEYPYNWRTILTWIHAVVVRNVKKFDFKFSLFSQVETIMLPSCLGHCASLEMFTLNVVFRSVSFKWFKGSNTLKVLRLDSVELLDHGLVQSFFVNCPLLEELNLINCITRDLDYLSISCPNLKTLRIDNRGLDYDTFVRYFGDEENKLSERLTVICPKLVYFEYGGNMANHFSFNVNSLVKAVIELQDMKLNNEYDDNFGASICELFAQVSHVEYLSINRFFHQSKGGCQCCNLPKEGFPESLPNLKKLELTLDCALMVVLLRILKCSFNLESLHLTIPKNISSYEAKRFVEELEEVEIRRTLTRHLKRVEFADFRGEEKTLAIAQFLLEHGDALEEMVFSWNSRGGHRKQLVEAMDKVSNFYKASASVKVTSLKD